MIIRSHIRHSLCDLWNIEFAVVDQSASVFTWNDQIELLQILHPDLQLESEMSIQELTNHQVFQWFDGVRASRGISAGVDFS